MTRRALLLVALALGLVLVDVGPANAEDIYWQFVKTGGAGNGRGRLNMVRQYHSPSYSEEFAQWRADSGSADDECWDEYGWLPDGWYHYKQTHDSWGGQEIRGRVNYFTDKYCKDGWTLRSALFIHTEETDGWGQECTGAYDDKWCWDGDHDYKSIGCIKINHSPDSSTHHDYVHTYQWGGHDPVMGYYELVVWQEA